MHFRLRAFFQYSVLLLSAQMISSFFPTKPNGSHLSSARPTTHSFHKAFFDCSVPLGAFLSDSGGLGLKHSFQVVLCSRNAAKSFPTLPQGPALTDCWAGLSLTPDHAPTGCCYWWEGKADTVARSSKWIAACRELFICFNLKRLAYTHGIVLEKTWQKAKQTIKTVTE